MQSFKVKQEAHRDQYFRKVNEYSKTKANVRDKAQAILLGKVARSLETESDTAKTIYSKGSQEVMLSKLSRT